MKINDIAVLKKDCINSYKRWDKGELVKVVDIAPSGVLMWVTVTDKHDNLLSVYANSLELAEKGAL